MITQPCIECYGSDSDEAHPDCPLCNGTGEVEYAPTHSIKTCRACGTDFIFINGPTLCTPCWMASPPVEP